MGRAVGKNAERWRWLVYVALALVGALLTFVGARAQQKATDDATFRKLVDNFCAAWSTGNAEAPGKFYAKDSGSFFTMSLLSLTMAGRNFTTECRKSFWIMLRRLS